MIAAPALEAASALATAFPSTWPSDIGIVPTSTYPSWPWMHPPQLPSQQVPWLMSSGPGSMPPQLPWMMQSAPGSMPYPEMCWPPLVHAEASVGRTRNADNAARAARRQRRKLNDEVATERTSGGRKARQIWVQPGGEIDGACPGKNGWDDAVRGLVPRILDISVVDWEGQKQEAMQKLSERLDAKFKYLDNPLSMQGFQNAVKRFLKSERSRLKMRYRSGDTSNPVHVQPVQWECLKQYWCTEK
jgi:hypothetical protein